MPAAALATRFLTRRTLAAAAVLLLALLGFLALTHLLRDVHFQQIRAAWATIGAGRFVLAILLTIAGYLALTFYDVLALRAVGRPLPWRVAALASFTSYAVGNNLGLSFLTGGSARYRVYSAEGLGVGDVARVVALASLAFWSGLLGLSGLLLLSGAALPPLAGVQLPPPAAMALGGLLLLGPLALLAWTGKTGRTLRFRRFRLQLPGRRLAAALLLVAVTDLASSSMVLLALVPGASLADWPAFFVAYTLAVAVALVSAVPGGVGVFEAVLVAALPAIGRPELVAALLGYRLVYYLLPLLVAGVLVVAGEGERLRHPAAAMLRGGQAVVAALAPLLVATLTFVGGLLLLFSGSIPAERGRMRLLYELVPLPFIEVSHLLASVVGVALLLLSAGLYRRLDGAAFLARLLLLSGGLFSLLKGLDYEEAATMLLIAGLLQWTRKSFYRKTRLTAALLSPAWLATVALMVGLSVWLGLFAFKHVAYRNELWWHFSAYGDASRFLRANVVLVVVLLALALSHLLRPAGAGPWPAEGARLPPGEALALSSRTDSNLAFVGDKRFLCSPSGRSFLMYRVRGRSWIVMGDPVGDAAEWRELLWALLEQADAAQGRLLLYQIGMETVPIAIDLGLQIVKYGEEARVDLASFNLDGPAAKSLRYALRRCEKDGASFEVIPAAGLAPHLPRLRAVSDRWLAGKGHREKGFSVGRFDADYLLHFDCAVVHHGGQIIAFANIWTTADRLELSIDLMRHDEGAPAGTMDFLLVKLMEWGREEGYRWFTLGLAPLSGLEARRLAPIWARLGSLLYRHGASFYGFEGLRQYKGKFSPLWAPRFIAGPRGLAFGRAIFDLQALISAPVR